MKQRKILSKKNAYKNSLNEFKLFKKNNSNISNNISLPNHHLKKEILFSNKSQKQIVLALIKSSQVSILSKIKNSKSNKKEIIKFIKKLLYELKNNLQYILKEKNVTKTHLENNYNNNKNQIQLKFSDKYKNNSETNTEMVEKNYEGNELSKLKLLNFEIENEIIKTDSLYKNIQYTINCLKITNLFPEYNREIYLSNKIKTENIDEIFNELKEEEKKKLNKTIIKKNIQNKEIEKYKEEINEMKQNIELINNIDSTDIILEEPSESIVMSNFNTYCNGFNNSYNISKLSNDLKTLNSQNIDYLNCINSVDKNNFDIFNLNRNNNLNVNIKKYINKVINKSFDGSVITHKDYNINIYKEYAYNKVNNKYKDLNNSYEENISNYLNDKNMQIIKNKVMQKKLSI